VNVAWKLSCVIVLVFVATASRMAMGVVLNNDAKAFSRAELYAYLGDKTQTLSNGGAFYSSSGTLHVLRDGQRYKGTWSSHDGGTICWHVIGWGNVPCKTYYDNGDAISVVYEGVLSLAPGLSDGNTLDNLAAGTELLSKAETVLLLAGKTVIWGPSRGLYYGADYSLTKIWDGVRGVGSWSVTDAGAVCWHIPGWGVTPCQSYYYNGDVLMAIYNDQREQAHAHVEGNQIGSF
jgi:hypothetical protein